MGARGLGQTICAADAGMRRLPHTLEVIEADFGYFHVAVACVEWKMGGLAAADEDGMCRYCRVGKSKYHQGARDASAPIVWMDYRATKFLDRVVICVEDCNLCFDFW